MARYGMLINIDKCNGCYNCFLACRDEYEGNDYLPLSAAQPAEGKSWMKVTEKERGSVPKVKVDYIPMPCLHCADAPCVNKPIDKSVYRRPDGIVIIDPEKAKSKKDIVVIVPTGSSTGTKRTCPEVYLLRPPPRYGMEGAPLRPGVPG